MTTLRSLLVDSRDGEWGKGDPADGRIEMRVIRGTDFANVREGVVDAVPTRYLETRHADRKRAEPWDILIETAGGSPDKPTGRTLLLTPRVIELLGVNVTCASFARFLRIDSDLADPAFVFWMLQHHYHARNLFQFHTQHTGVARFQFTTFASTFEFDLPDLQTQRRIASILGAYDDLISVNRRRGQVLEDMAQGLFKEWFVRFRFPGHETALPTPHPDGWARVKVGSILRKFKRPHKIKKQDYVEGGAIPCIDQGLAFIGGYTDKRESMINAPLPLVVFGDHTRILKFVTFPFASGADGTQLIYPTCGVSSEYLYFALLNVDLSNQHYARHFKFLKDQDIWAPTSQFMDCFTDVVRPLMQQVQNFRFQNRSLASSRDLLLPRLISGQLSVEVAERELAEVA